jgi:hypothetical protein
VRALLYLGVTCFLGPLFTWSPPLSSPSVHVAPHTADFLTENKSLFVHFHLPAWTISRHSENKASLPQESWWLRVHVAAPDFISPSVLPFSDVEAEAVELKPTQSIHSDSKTQRWSSNPDHSFTHFCFTYWLTNACTGSYHAC